MAAVARLAKVAPGSLVPRAPASRRVDAKSSGARVVRAGRARAVVRAQSVSEPPAAEKASAAEKAPGGSFDWHKAWYPMSPVDFLDPDVPNPMKLLGRSIVAWKAEDGRWGARIRTA